MKKIILICCTLFLFSNVWFAAMLDGKAKETTVFIALIKIYKGQATAQYGVCPFLRICGYRR